MQSRQESNNLLFIFIERKRKVTSKNIKIIYAMHVRWLVYIWYIKYFGVSSIKKWIIWLLTHLTAEQFPDDKAAWKLEKVLAVGPSQTEADLPRNILTDSTCPPMFSYDLV